MRTGTRRELAGPVRPLVAASMRPARCGPELAVSWLDRFDHWWHRFNEAGPMRTGTLTPDADGKTKIPLRSPIQDISWLQ